MNAPRCFQDRAEAGEILATALQRAALPAPCVVLALPRGGLPVAVPVAHRIGAELDVMSVRKIGLPGNPECAIGAVAPGVVYRDDAIPTQAGVDDTLFRRLAASAEIQRQERERLFRAQRPMPDLRNGTTILVDDGIATGATMIAAARAARAAGARRLILAAPVASPEAVERLRDEADGMVVVLIPAELLSVGEWYRSFPQVEDSEALALLDRERA
jgi:putative phosphoribosyl transferase